MDRFCPECRLKVLRAYSLLVGEVEPAEEKGYKPILYLGLKCCPAEKHIHVQCNVDLMSLLIARAEPELVGRFVFMISRVYIIKDQLRFHSTGIIEALKKFFILVSDERGMRRQWKLLRKRW